MRQSSRLGAFNVFDLTPAILSHLHTTLRRRSIQNVELLEADVLDLDALPSTWRDYDLIVSASMLEYVPRERFVEACAGCRSV